ncbi:SNF2-related protein [Geodermatophilus sp. SYSU D00710]
MLTVPRRPRPSASAWGQDDLFSVDPASYLPHELAGLPWPVQGRFPVNHARAHVRDVVDDDLIASGSPLLVVGYSSIAALIELVSAWRHARGDEPGTVRLLLGSEPFRTQRTHFRSAHEAFTEEVRGYWLERSISVLLSAKVIRALEELDNGSLQVRVMPGPHRLHAKIYLGGTAATVGSSNFTDYGMARQIEANARFEKDGESSRYGELAQIAENLWAKGSAWDDEFRRLLGELLRLVTWREALARACAELLEGDWAGPLLERQDQHGRLWPSQNAGIAQALWVVENLGSVLVADATGSGKTRMGAHLVAAVRSRLLDSGRMRRDRDLTTLVCPPAVRETWQREALSSGITILPVSQGLLSRPDPAGPRVEESAVARAQVLAIDEAHNFLAPGSKRTRHVRESLADHVLLFTATPISRGAQDLLSLVGLLGADNFDDATLEVLERLDRGAGVDEALSDEQRAQLRREIQGFTVRRTKSMLNELVAQHEDAYRHPHTGRVCRYPTHRPELYVTGETSADEAAADAIRAAADQLRGLVQLGRRIRVPEVLRREVSDEQWLGGRLAAARGLARHQVLAAMRSSRAALVEHVAGTAQALRAYGLPDTAKLQASGDVIAKVTALVGEGPPQVELGCALPDWLSDPQAWRAACRHEADLYRAIRTHSASIGPAREQTKAALLARLAGRHRLVLAFDRHPITLAAVREELRLRDTEVLVATGGTHGTRRRVETLFAPDSPASAIALCSDALNEGLNLQGAAALVHLDLPTTLRVAEQRVGRVDRMDSPHEEITVWWPEDGKAFATREVELLLTRRHASESLLGSNLPVPAFAGHDEDAVVSVEEQIREFDRPHVAWDGLRDALDPVRRLVHGHDALVPPDVYAEHRHTRHRVLARVAPVASATPWAFLALAGTRHGPPRWLMLEGEPTETSVGVEAVAQRLRTRLREDPPDVPFDENCERWLGHFLTVAAQRETLLLPRRMQRALEQMAQLTDGWAEQAARRGSPATAEQWRRLHNAARPSPDDDVRLDPYLVGEMWWDLVRPRFADLQQQQRRRRRYSRLRDLDPLLRARPLEIADVLRALERVPAVEPVDKRVSAVIIGVPH